MLLVLATATLSGVSVAVLTAARGDPIEMFDTDRDGLLDLWEVKTAASALFARLDRDRDGMLDKSELAGRWSAKKLAAADPNRDGRLTVDEYHAVVAQHFNTANADGNDKLDPLELKSR